MDDPLRPAREELFAKRGEPDPTTVELYADNVDSAKVYMLTRCQVITSEMGQVIDISIPAVNIAMDLCGVKDKLICLTRVRGLFHHFLEK